MCACAVVLRVVSDCRVLETVLVGADRDRGRRGPVWVGHVRDRHVTVREVIT